MGLFKNIKAASEAFSVGTAMPPRLSEEQLAHFSPKQRAAYEANMAQIAAAGVEIAEAQGVVDAIQEDHRGQVAAKVAGRPLFGPAGEWVFGDTRALPASGEARNDDGRLALAERAARDAARAPYLATTRSPVHFTRIGTRAKDELDDLAASLASTGLAGRPDLVFGVYRVPDHMTSGLTTEKGRYVEWEIVHAATGSLPAAAAPTAVVFAADEPWVARAPGEPSVLDEDLAVAYLAAAGVGPERTSGVARLLRTKDVGTGGGDGGYTLGHVDGVVAFQSADASTAARDQMVASRPIALPTGPPPGTYTEVLNWRAIARAVQPDVRRPSTVPSPFPYLPSTPQELVTAYLDIVGVNPADSYSAQVTEDRARDLQLAEETRSDDRMQTFTHRTNTGTKQPCADGKDRPRLLGGSRVVLVYRDRPEHADGRHRWAAYERDVLQAALNNETEVRRPVEAPPLAAARGLAGKLLGAAEKVANVVSADHAGPDEWARIPPHRYCWPPTGTG